MKTPRFAAVAVPAFALAIAFAGGCTNDSTALIPSGTGNVIGGSYGGAGSSTTSGGSGGGGSGGTESSASDAGSSTPPPGTGGDDANAPRPDPDAGDGGKTQDSGSGGFGVDGQVPVIDSGSPQTGPTGPLGSCTNPACGTDGNECGCQATDSQGNTVQLGCQAGGQCACFVNGNQDTNAFDENGACNSQQATAQQFLQYCVNSCN